MPLPRVLRYWLRRFTRALTQAHESPRQIAGGAAIGTFIGITPALGLHIIFALLISTFMRCSRVMAVICCFITNPVTWIPIWGACYATGCWVLRPFGFTLPSYETVRRSLHAGAKSLDWNIWHKFLVEVHAVVKVGLAGMLPLCVGCIIVGSLAAVAMYWIVLRLVTGHRILKAQRVALRAQKRIERIRRQQEFDRLVSGETEP